jgi:hypothetical protein
MAVIPNQFCSRSFEYPIRRRDEKQNQRGEFMQLCTPCRQEDAEASTQGRLNDKMSDKTKFSQIAENSMDDSDPQMDLISGRVYKKVPSHPMRRDEDVDRPGEFMRVCTACGDKEDSGDSKETPREHIAPPEVDAASFDELSRQLTALSTAKEGQSSSAEEHVEFPNWTGNGEESPKKPRCGDDGDSADGLTQRMSGFSTAADLEAEELGRQIDSVQRIIRDPTTPAYNQESLHDLLRYLRSLQHNRSPGN